MKKFSSFMLTLMLILSTAPMGVLNLTVRAETTEYYTYSVYDNEATIEEVNPSISGEIHIPDTLGGYPVTAINHQAFMDCTFITSVTIPDSIYFINHLAFSNCSNITSIKIGTGLNIISVRPFSGCTSLTEIIVDPDNNYFCSIDGVLYNKAVTTIYHYPSGSKNSEYIFPDSVSSIFEGAFDDCHNLTSITIPNSLNSVDELVYSGVSDCNISEILVSESNNSYTSIDGVLFSKDTKKLLMYPSGKVCNSYSIPSGVTQISQNAFLNCKSIKSITIPNSVTTFYSTFNTCSNLTEINVEEGNQYYCDIDGVLFNKNATILITYPSGKMTSTYTIPDNVTTVDSNAFYNCTNLVSVTFPDSVTTIGINRFIGCANLAEINVSENNKYYCDIDGVLFNKNATILITYPSGKATNTYDIPSSVTYIEDTSFINCDILLKITIPKSVTSISPRAINMCKNLTIYGYEGSCAQTYANENEIPFIAISPQNKPGDTNCDGSINGKDYALLLQYLNGWNVTIDEDAADVNGDDKINGKDYAMLLQFINDWDIELQ